jgi:hypothetical protein
MSVVLDSTHEEYDGPTVTVSLTIENTYARYAPVTTYATDVVIPEPPPGLDMDPYDDWAFDHIYCFTGTGRTDGDSWYDVTITASSDPELVGREFAWGY